MLRGTWGDQQLDQMMSFLSCLTRWLLMALGAWESRYYLQ